MFGAFYRSDENPELERVIASVYAEMDTYGPDSAEFEQQLTYLERLSKLKTEDRVPRVSRDTLVLAGANLLGIVIIVFYEQKHVMVSKAKDYVLKLK